MKATILITTEIGRAGHVQQRLLELGAEQSHLVAGIYDVLVTLVVDEPSQLGEWVVEKIHAIPGVERTVTLLHLN